MSNQIINQVVISQENFNALLQKIDNIQNAIPNMNTEVEEIMSPEEARKFLKCGTTTLWRYQNEEGLPFHKIQKNVYYLKSELVEWLKKK